METFKYVAHMVPWRDVMRAESLATWNRSRDYLYLVRYCSHAFILLEMS
ncbi:hypothetical protein [Metallosphaera yellowstonensis]|nr:hypothetical protein [Metallosphaera yellowstonensis]